MAHPAEYASEEWLPEYTDYVLAMGRQQLRLESEKRNITVEYTHSYVRFVEDIESLTVGYGLLTKDKKDEIPALKLDLNIYEELTELGTAVKIINGYINECDEAHPNPTFTPDTPNVYVPHISYVIQWGNDTLPELVPGGMLHDQDGCSILFMSGSKPFDKVENFYNFIYKEEKDKKISIYSGNKVADVYMPYVLHNALAELDIFKDDELTALSEKMVAKFPYIKDAEGAIAKAKNIVYYTLRFLTFLFLNDFESIFEKRQDTVNVLLEDFLKKENIKIERKEKNKKILFKKDSLTSALKNNRLKFQQAALKRIKSNLANFTKEERELAENVIEYISYSLTLKKLEDIEESKKFWGIIQTLGNHITCPNPDSKDGGICSGAERLRKYALQGYNGSHTEALFVKLMKAEPSLLIQGLTKAISTAEKASDTERPNLLGIIVDSFSWLDTCENCGGYLHNNTLWGQILKDFVSLKEIKKYFTLPLSSIDSVFRVVSQERYNGPSNLSNAKGGKDYTVSGWNYRVLSEKRYTLGTRTNQQESQLCRDKIFERIQATLMRAALIQPLEFWDADYASWPLTQERSFTGNIREIIALRFPETNAVKIKK